MGEKNKYQICVVTGTRAEYGLLRRLLFRFKINKYVELKLFVTGSHLDRRFGNTQKEIVSDGFEDYLKIEIPLEDDSKEGMAYATGIALQKFAEEFANYKPDIMIVLGDRYEIFAAGVAAHLSGIPIGHIGGGDVTEGAVDDAIRHSLTKMSNLHFPGCEQSARKIIQMGEQPDSVFNVGEPGVENCININFMSREELALDLKFDNIRGEYSVVTFHPVTLERNTAVEQVHEVIQALNQIPGMSYVITMANADAGGRKINSIWLEESKKYSNWLVVSSLGVVRYLSAMKYAKLVIGNSSSGIIEAPSIGVPTINIGDRQKGRMCAESIINCAPQKEQIVSAIEKGLGDLFQKKAKNVKSPFGDGTTSKQIEKIVMEYLKNDKQIEKTFYEIDF
ncbi:UDP-N-acetylglucosamine 2-epimerase (hydrolyzing) [Blautia sp. AM16-16B]|nr:UDP-N-acetylglucosamine 2-epimerase (hydrolyzing) [Blautia sp. AM16-16B]